MKPSLALALALFACTPALARAEAKPTPPSRAPESLLPADCQLYFRYDGFEPHRKAYEKTALAKVMKEDLGELFRHLGTLLKGPFMAGADGPGLWVGNLSVNELPDPKESLAQWGKFLDYFWQHGIVIGVEVRDSRARGADKRLAGGTPDVQLTFIFPEGGTEENRIVVMPLLKTLAVWGKNDIHQRQIHKRLIYEATQEGLFAAWWQEGHHVVLTYGAKPRVKHALDVIDGRARNLTSTPLYRSVTRFDRYETDVRGYVDLKSIIALLEEACVGDDEALANLRAQVATRIVCSQLGLTGLESLTFHLGFDGKNQRSTVVLNVVEPARRQGLLGLITTPLSFAPENLPPLPPDAAGVSIHHVAWERVYEGVERIVARMRLASFVSGGDWMPEQSSNLNEVLGLDVRKDLLPSLDSTVVLYNAFSEGPSILGQGVAIKVKDEKRLRKSLEAMNKALRRNGDEGSKVGFQSVKYRGATLHILSADRPSIPLTYTVHKGWLVLGVFPQSVKGYVLRSEGEHRVWKAPANVPKLIEQGLQAGGPNSKLAALSISDPRPMVELGLPLLPALVQFMGWRELDPKGSLVARLPNARIVADRLFPGVTVFCDDGKALRWESHYAIYVPEFFLTYFGVGALAAYAPGVQTWVPDDRLELPSGRYLERTPQPAGPSPDSLPALPPPGDSAPAPSSQAPASGQSPSTEKPRAPKTPSSAGPSSQEKIEPGLQKIHTRKKKFNLPVAIERSARATLKECQLYVRFGAGEWKLDQTIPAAKTCFAYCAERDGEYSFAVVTVDNSGRTSCPDPKQMTPGLVVVVNSQTPAAPSAGSAPQSPAGETPNSKE
jgi:hypothetical protein